MVVGYGSNGKGYDNTLQKVLQVSRCVNLKLNKDKCHFRCTSIPIFGEVISRHGVRSDPQELKELMEMPHCKTKKELQAILGINNYLGKFSLSSADIC